MIQVDEIARGFFPYHARIPSCTCGRSEGWRNVGIINQGRKSVLQLARHYCQGSMGNTLQRRIYVRITKHRW
jgi:hypothetical protein